MMSDTFEAASFEAAIQQVPLFVTLPDHEIRHLAQTLRPIECEPGTILFREDERGDRFYIIHSGQIEIIKALATADERLIGVRGAGEHVGEMSLFNRDGLRTASARVLSPARVLEMTRSDFDSLLNRQPTLAYEIVRVLSMWLNQAHNTTIYDLRIKNRELTEAYDSLKAAQAQIIEKEKLEHELHVAWEVQASLLPRSTPRLPGWEFAACWLPAREVSGDYYDFIPLQSGPEWGIVLADVSGKGMPAALFMALTRSTIRATLASAARPADSLSRANQLICADAVGSMFVTMFYGQLNPVTGDLIYVNAGHDPPWVYRAEQDEWQELTRTGLALGMLNVRTHEQETLRLNSGDFILMYTDGLTDAADPRGQRFGSDQVRQMVIEHRRAAPGELATALTDAVTRFRAERPLFDDITLVVIKRL